MIFFMKIFKIFIKSFWGSFQVTIYIGILILTFKVQMVSCLFFEVGKTEKAYLVEYTNVEKRYFETSRIT